jgi:hypothetical protein
MPLALERGFRRLTVACSVAALGLGFWMILWPAVEDARAGLVWVGERNHRFVVQTDAGPYLVGSRRQLTDDALDALFRRIPLEADGDERVSLLHADPARRVRDLLGRISGSDYYNTPQASTVVGPRRAVWSGVALFLSPYLFGTLAVGIAPWVLFYSLRWIVRGFRAEANARERLP